MRVTYRHMARYSNFSHNQVKRWGAALFKKKLQHSGRARTFTEKQVTKIFAVGRIVVQGTTLAYAIEEVEFQDALLRSQQENEREV